MTGGSPRCRPHPCWLGFHLRVQAGLCSSWGGFCVLVTLLREHGMAAMIGSLGGQGGSLACRARTWLGPHSPQGCSGRTKAQLALERKESTDGRGSSWCWCWVWGLLIVRTPRGQRNWLPWGVRTRTDSFLLQICYKPTDFGPSDLPLRPCSLPHHLTPSLWFILHQPPCSPSLDPP